MAMKIDNTGIRYFGIGGLREYAMKLCRKLRLGLLVGALSASPANAERYAVHWTAVEHDLTPVRQILTHGYVARFSFDAGRFASDENGFTAETSAGQPAEFITTRGTQHRIVYTVRGRTILRNDTFPGFSIMTLVTPDGRGGCLASVHYRKSPGKATFESQRYDGSGASTANRVEAANVRCEATATLQ